MYLLTKEDKKVSITKTDTGWSYKKEFGSAIIENFDIISKDKLDGMLLELKGLGYKSELSYIEGNMRPNSVIIGGKLCRDSSVSFKEWRVGGLLHRDDAPAAEFFYKNKFFFKNWYKNGKKHRENGPAYEDRYGRKEWWLDGMLHREDGPAVEHSSGSKYWYKHNKKHRENGPAVELDNGIKQWWTNGVLIKEEKI